MLTPWPDHLEAGWSARKLLLATVCAIILTALFAGASIGRDSLQTARPGVAMPAESVLYRLKITWGGRVRKGFDSHRIASMPIFQRNSDVDDMDFNGEKMLLPDQSQAQASWTAPEEEEEQNGQNYGQKNGRTHHSQRNGRCVMMTRWWPPCLPCSVKPGAREQRGPWQRHAT